MSSQGIVRSSSHTHTKLCCRCHRWSSDALCRSTQVHITTFTEEERTALRGRLTCLGASVLDRMEQHNLPHVLIAKQAKGNKYEVRALSGGVLDSMLA